MPPRPRCPADRVLSILSGPWTTYILWVLYHEEELRFAELRRRIPGISARVLAERLGMLEVERLVSRREGREGGRSVSYALTGRGRELRPMIDALDRVTESWEKEEAEA
jgi:DNA-binding HxlR family transcriptional regulator